MFTVYRRRMDVANAPDEVIGQAATVDEGEQIAREDVERQGAPVFITRDAVVWGDPVRGEYGIRDGWLGSTGDERWHYTVKRAGS